MRNAVQPEANGSVLELLQKRAGPTPGRELVIEACDRRAAELR
jgi:hypothetical protein